MGIICIKTHIIEQKNCLLLQTGLRINNNGFVIFNFNTSKCIIEIISLRGADNLIIVNGTQHLLKPNSPTLINVYSNMVKICRINKSRGHIVISNIFDDNTEEENVNLKNIKFKGIQNTNFGTFAQEFAEIEDKYLNLNLETDPYNSWIRKGEKIIFINPCRIISIVGIVASELPVPTPTPLTLSTPTPPTTPTTSTPLTPLTPTVTAQSIIKDKYHFDDIDSELWFKRIEKNIKIGQFKTPISFCKINTTTTHERIFINEFYLNENLDNLHCAKTIITPSLINYVLLKNKFPNKNIKICGRLLPIEIKECKKQNQVLLFNKDSEKTKKIIDEWDESVGKLVVVGFVTSNKKVTSIVDNLSLEEISSLILSSDVILDIGICNNYISSILEFAIGVNISIITNNVRYIMCKNASFINNEFDISKIKIEKHNYKLKENYQKIFYESINTIFKE